jgi:hypothetical protein
MVAGQSTTGTALTKVATKAVTTAGMLTTLESTGGITAVILVVTVIMAVMADIATAISTTSTAALNT